MKYVQLVVMLAFIAMGCSGTKETSAKRSTPSGGSSEADEYERSFTPADHDPDNRTTQGQRAQNGSTTAPGSDTSASAESEMIQGFRVQLLATTDIDEVTNRKALLEQTFPTEWFYVEFDPPVYKLRAGNFTTRYEADRFARTLATQGFPDAWSVPARVFKNPPPVPPKTAVPTTDSTGTANQNNH
jgi:hypothetical protein